MRLVVLDFETYFRRQDTELDPSYTLSKLSTEAYIRDKRFEAHGAAVKWSANTPAKWYDEKQLRFVLAQEDWSDVFLVCHHTQFDGLILSHHYNVHPARLGCTLSMARLLLGNHLSVSLDQVRKHFNMPFKSTPYSLFDGRHWHEITRDVQAQIAEGACDEVESIFRIFHLLRKDFPREELRIIDSTLKMFTEPVLHGDIPLLVQVWQDEKNKKQNLREQLNVTESQLQSAEKFAALLREEGVEPEKKNGKNGEIYAFDKKDQFMRDLLEDESPRVQTLAQARLRHKSSLLQSRAETMARMAARGSLCIYLRYCGAHTTRWSGGDFSNLQNLPRGSNLRRAIMAPPGFLLAAIDLSQVECRILNYLAGQHDVIERFKKGEDIYVGIASQFYGRQITRNDPAERGTGKQLELSCGFGCGAVKFKATARLGIYGPPVQISADQAKQAVDLYRRTHGNVVNYWREAESYLPRLAQGSTLAWGPLAIKDRKIYLPNGAPLNYLTLEWHVDDEYGDSYWRLLTRTGWTKLYGAKLVENVIQALARIVMSQAMLRIEGCGYRVVNTTHDELLVLIPKDGHEEKHAERCAAEMKIAPDWLPGIPLDAEWSIGERYSK